MEIDEPRLRAFAPALDLETTRAWLDALVAVCRGDAGAGPVAQLPPRARFHFLTARRSAIVQVSPTHVGRTRQPDNIVEHLLQRMVRVPR